MILITGGAGFIGSHLVRRLIDLEYRVRILDILMRRGSALRINRLVNRGDVEFMQGDIRYKETVDRAMRDVKYVFHEAATCINRSRVYTEETLDININGSYLVFKAALDHGAKVVFASSASVYGEPKKLPMAEEDDLDPLTPYCVSKAAGEHLLRFLGRSGLDYIVLRYFNVYGPGQNPDAHYTSIIPVFLRALRNGQAPEIIGDGRQSMDLVNVRDVIEANIKAMAVGIGGEIFNVGTGVSTTVQELAQTIAELVGSRISPVFRTGEVMVTRRRASIWKAEKMLGFKAETELRDGLREIIEQEDEDHESWT